MYTTDTTLSFQLMAGKRQPRPIILITAKFVRHRYERCQSRFSTCNNRILKCIVAVDSVLRLVVFIAVCNGRRCAAAGGQLLSADRTYPVLEISSLVSHSQRRHQQTISALDDEKVTLST